MAVNRATEPQLELSDIQGDILIGLQKNAELFVGFVILDVTRFKRFLRGLGITTCVDVKRAEAKIRAQKLNGGSELLDIRGLNIGFTFDGLKTLGAPDVKTIKDKSFVAGLAKRSDSLNDPVAGPGKLSNWLLGNGVGPLHGIILLTGKDLTTVRTMFSDLVNAAGPNTWLPFFTGEGFTRPKKDRGHEHFGYLDGVSQPAVRGRIDQAVPGEDFLNPTQSPDPNQGLPGADLHWPGAFVFGYESPDRTDVEKRAPPIDGGPKWMRNGSYMVYRRLEQLVPEFDKAIEDKAKLLKNTSPELLGARVVGRFKSGWPVIETGTDDPVNGDDPLLNNAFEFGDNDEDGAKCPFAAHIRKTYPRNDDTPDGGEPDTQTHRILRAGIPFGSEVQPDEASTGKSKHSRGLMFVCYQTSIENQFEFITQKWVNGKNFAKAGIGEDPVLGQAHGAARSRKIAGLAVPPDTAKITFEADFIRPTGGGYFFMPSISAIDTVLT
ncbi:Dyp-type peroxidase [Sphingomonas bacterium]|uniref:Dyp-type peroxidase n=1 Tax=Sphingomonas bacterium TaxID=1895847 RepID=UPI001574F6B9|nr:Dyp-type peroxidase [Sphingomonas bacterium]